jgi:hypothetical protein
MIRDAAEYGPEQTGGRRPVTETEMRLWRD